MLLLTCAALFWSVYAGAAPGELGDAGGVNDNPHNLSQQSTTPGGETDIKATSETQICVFCHIPHGGTPNTTLWGRPAPNAMGNMSIFPTFDTNKVKDPGDTGKNLGIDDPVIIGTTQYNAASGDYPNGASKLCLSCHDGITAIGTLVNSKTISVNGGTGTTMIGAGSSKYFAAAPTTYLDLSASHPISFVYTSAVVTYLNSAAANKLYNFSLPTAITLELDSNNNTRVQCTICHEPHMDTKVGGYTLPFWRAKGRGANQAADYDLTCKECHSATYYNPGTPDFHNIP